MQSVVVIVGVWMLVSVVNLAACGGRAGFREHNKIIAAFPCGKPQAKVMELEDVINEKVLQEYTERGLREKITPSVTVLHRCESTGCCDKPDERCMMAQEDDVILTFTVSNNIKMNYLEVAAKNHTKCFCRKQKDKNIK